MHLIKNIIEHVVNLVSGREDSAKVHKQEQECKQFRSAWLKEGSNILPKAPFTLAKEEIVLADGFDWRPCSIFASPTGIKSHEWKELSCDQWCSPSIA